MHRLLVIYNEPKGSRAFQKNITSKRHLPARREQKWRGVKEGQLFVRT